jgi:hypothetical protein
MLEQGAETLADNPVILGEQDGDWLELRFWGNHIVVERFFRSAVDGFGKKGTRARTVVPFPGADVTLKSPPTISNLSRMPSSPSRLLVLVRKKLLA